IKYTTRIISRFYNRKSTYSTITKKKERKLIMKKTIKKNVHMRLDELIKYVRQNKKTLFEEHVAISFKTKDNKGVIFANNGNFVTGEGDCINIDDIFEVVIEEEITEDTKFEKCVVIFKDKTI